jgi:hypothetical protein
VRSDEGGLEIWQLSRERTIDHLETLFEAGPLTDATLYRNLLDSLNLLGGKLTRSIQGVEPNHQFVSDKNAKHEVET